MPNLGPTELIIILVIVVLLFGGSRLAGLGKSTGRALKEFKEETSGLRKADKDKAESEAPSPGTDVRAAELESKPQQSPVVDTTHSEVRKEA